MSGVDQAQEASKFLADPVHEERLDKILWAARMKRDQAASQVRSGKRSVIWRRKSRSTRSRTLLTIWKSSKPMRKQTASSFTGPGMPMNTMRSSIACWQGTA